MAFLKTFLRLLLSNGSKKPMPKDDWEIHKESCDKCSGGQRLTDAVIICKEAKEMYERHIQNLIERAKAS